MSNVEGRKQRTPLRVLQVHIPDEEPPAAVPPPPPAPAPEPQLPPAIEPIEASLFDGLDSLMVHRIPGMTHDPIEEPLPPDGRLFNADKTRNQGVPKDGSFNLEYFREKIKREFALYSDLWYQFAGLVAGATGRGSRAQQFWRVQDTGAKMIESILENLDLTRPSSSAPPILPGNYVPFPGINDPKDPKAPAAPPPPPAFDSRNAPLAAEDMAKAEEERLRKLLGNKAPVMKCTRDQLLCTDANPAPAAAINIGNEHLERINDPNVMLLRLMVQGKANDSALRAWDALYHQGQFFSRAKSVVDPKDQMARLQLEQMIQRMAKEGDVSGVAWREAPLNLGALLVTDELRMAISMAYEKVRNVSGKGWVTLIDLITHARVRVYFAKLTALEMLDPTSGSAGRYLSARQSTLIIQAQQNMLDCFKHLERDAGSFLYFAHIQTAGQEYERRVTDAQRKLYQERTGHYYSDVYDSAPLPQVGASNKKPKYGEWAQQQQDNQRKQLLRSVL
jgi:hypothetical protein